MVVRARMVAANGLEFGLLEAGEGPLVLCLHGFPDSAHTWRHLLPALAEAGFHAVAPFLRGYAPTAVPDDACYSIGALVADAVALHQALDGDGQAVLIGHDWGAEAAYGAAAFAPDRWRRVVTLGVPPLALDPVLSAITSSSGGSSTCSGSGIRWPGLSRSWPPTRWSFWIGCGRTGPLATTRPRTLPG
jgi:pimeloyl-ACP methyl ester carboxylesterase